MLQAHSTTLPSQLYNPPSQANLYWSLNENLSIQSIHACPIWRQSQNTEFQYYKEDSFHLKWTHPLDTCHHNSAAWQGRRLPMFQNHFIGSLLELV